MHSNKIKGLLCTLFTVLVILVLGALGEVFFRAFFPEYRDGIVTLDIIHGKKIFRTQSEDFAGSRVRLRGSSIALEESDRVVLVFGDSITFGYGLAFEDVYWSYWQRMLELEGAHVRIIATSDFGNNSKDVFEGIRHIVAEYRNKNIPIEGVIYQFNLNDLLPCSNADIRNRRAGADGRPSNRGWLSKVVFATSDLRLKVLNHSVMFRVVANWLARLTYPKSVSSEKLGFDAMGEYTYSFGAKGFEVAAQKLWTEFEQELRAAKADLKNIPCVIMLTPTAQMIDPDLKMHPMSRPKRFDCATLDPRKVLAKITREAGVSYVDPTDYMKECFDNYLKGENGEPFYHLNDDNHFNEAGARCFAEYGYVKIFKCGALKELLVSRAIRH